MRRKRCAYPTFVSVRFDRYLTAALRAIVNGHKQSQIDALLPWNYARKV